MRWSKQCLLRYLLGVTAKASPSLHKVVADLSPQVDASESTLTSEDMTKRHRMAQLRIGGAQMLAATKQHHLMNNDDYNPLYFVNTSLKGSGLCASLRSCLHRLKIHRLTELQGALIPLVLSGKHVVAHAETGTGKSFGVALSIANRIARQSINYRLHTIVLVPSEELALQYEKWLRHFAGCAHQIVQSATENVPLEAQLARIHNIKPHVLVGTPQRISDISRMSPQLLGEKLRRSVDTLIIDEADLVLSTEVISGNARMTGADVVDRLYRSHHQEVAAQLVALSATIDGNTAQRLNAWMQNDRAVRLTSSFLEHTIPASITFYFIATNLQHSLQRCLELCLRLIFCQHNAPKILVFTNDDPDCVAEKVSACLSDVCGAVAASLHNTGDSQNIAARQLVTRKRDVELRNKTVISKLSTGEVTIGVGAFLVARGLHINNITHVVIMGSPQNAQQFVHCAGRTGRMGKKGEVIVLFPPSAGRAVINLCDALELPFKRNKIEFVDELLNLERKRPLLEEERPHSSS